jgi:pimeloyl-ACP methyl ester carboxylesterase
VTVLDEIYWRSTGAGPAVVVPQLNVDWTQVDLAALEARFTVVVVSPRGFGPSERPGGYSGAGFVADVARVLDHLGVLEYAAFGYSMNGVMAARLAVGNPRVRAVACGGFPLTADLGAMGERAHLRHTAAQANAAAWAEVTTMYDPAAAEAFWDDVACRPRAALVDLACPVRCWWGAEDLVLGSLTDSAELAADLSERGVPYDVLPGLDHDAALDQLDLVLPRLADWLVAQLADHAAGH